MLYSGVLEFLVNETELDQCLKYNNFLMWHNSSFSDLLRLLRYRFRIENNFISHLGVSHTSFTGLNNFSEFLTIPFPSCKASQLVYQCHEDAEPLPF